MKLPTLPEDETYRIQDLISYDILDSEEEQEYDDLTRLAAQICHCESATITFIDKDRQWFKSRINAPLKQTPRDISFCAHTILQQNVMVVGNAKKDERFHDNPGVTGVLQITFYAGCPIISASGYALGTICVSDRNERNGLQPAQEAALKIIAGQIGKLLELRIKNKQIIQKSEALIKAEKKVMKLNQELQEEAYSLIAQELHENHAQTLTAIKLYIEFAQQSKDIADVFLEKSKERLLMVINELKKLSKSISPTTLPDGDYFALIESMVNSFGEQNEIKVSFNYDRCNACNNAKSGIKLYRIVEQQLAVAKEAGADTIQISFSSGQQLSLLFKYNGKIEKVNVEEQQSLSNVLAKADLLKGKTIYSKTSEGINIINIKMPIG